MKLKVFIISLLILFSIWLFTGERAIETINKPIKKKTSTTSYSFLGIRTVWAIDKTEELFSRTGKIIQQSSYDGRSCNEKIIYEYSDFDSIKKTVWFGGEKLIPYKFESIVYDPLKRPYQVYKYELKRNKAKTDTFLTEKTTYFYSGNLNFKTVVEEFEENYLPPDYIKPFVKSSGRNILTKKFNAMGYVISDTSRVVFDKDVGGRDEISITNYTYNNTGALKTKFSTDSIYYKTNKEGKVLEEKEKYGDFVRSTNKYCYDKKGHLIKSFLGIDDGLTYEYVYDKNNRLIKEYRPGNFILIFSPVVLYKYEYY